MPLVSIIFLLIHLGILLMITVQLLRSLSVKKRLEPRFANTYLIFEILLIGLFLLCMISYQLSSFESEKYFPEFAILTCFSFLCFWIGKRSIKWGKNWQVIFLSLTGTLFWLSVLTFFKFLPYMPYVWFPLLGILAISPLYFLLLTFSEINFRCKTDVKIPIYKILLLGLIPLVFAQLVMNLYTPEHWELIKMFNPENTVI